ncbi:GNAT family N-acetyltransferase [Sporolactobacillus sp. CPB3-1]|uniref:GNAT family N-acetyltransferase n=1 Tax=Sporolactobacillus mangiferae TaxID=2940498 RepID=A0ABT0M9D0_9BACL|nr:GNAT family N-acetyltransferase [Sporolactobacillus mangiferae]MCL1631488.1 GNAT family N-acetyltransferase [Sporolactobacillus mangiferae]
MNPAIIQIRPEQFSQCIAIWDQKIPQSLADRFYAQLVNGNRRTFVYIRDGAFCGEISLVFDMQDPDYTIKGRRVYLSRLMVKKSERHQGIGSALVDFLIDYARRSGYQELSVGVDLDNTIAQHLYTKKGFTRILFEGEDAYGAY